MSYPIHIQGFEGQTIEVVPPGILSGPQLLINGQPAPRGPKRGEMILTRTDGSQVSASWKPRYLGLDWPQLQVNGQLIDVVQPLKWYELVWSGMPIFLFFTLNVAGVILGAACFLVNLGIFRSRRMTLLRFVVTGVFSTIAAIISFALNILLDWVYWHWQDSWPAVSSSELMCVSWSISLLLIAGISTVLFVRATNADSRARLVGISLLGVLVICCALTWMWMTSLEPPTPFWKPSHQDIGGTYVLSQHSIDELGEMHYTQIRTPSSITLKEDETFESTDLPDLFWYGKKNQQQSGSGTWRFDKIADGRWVLQLVFTKLDGQNTNEHSILYLSGNKPPYTIYYSLGELSALVFEKAMH